MAIYSADLRTHVANETWAQQLERIQRSALDKAVSVVNRMISSAENEHNSRGVDALPNAIDDGQYDGDLTLSEQVKVNIKAKTSVLLAVIVRCLHTARTSPPGLTSSVCLSALPGLTLVPGCIGGDQEPSGAL